MTSKVQEDKVCANDGVERFPGGDVQDACKNYFNNKKRDEKRKSNGTFEKHRALNRSTNRKRRKLKVRRQVLATKQANLNPAEQWEKAAFALVTVGLDAMSSEEDPNCSSDEEVDMRKLQSRTSNGKHRRVKHRPWINPEVSEIMQALDDGYTKHIATGRQKTLKWKLIRDASCSISDAPVPDKILHNDSAKWMLNIG